MCKALYPLVFLLALTAFCLPKAGLAQRVNLGTPPVQNYSKKHYKAGTQVWSAVQADNGICWFGNTEGLLEFDGMHWRLHPLPNHTIVRSVATDNQGKIFVGGQDEFGYFSAKPNGYMQYQSLSATLPPEHGQFGDVWNIEARAEGVFFRTDNQVFHFRDNALHGLFPAGSKTRFMGEWMGKLLVQDGNERLYTFENNGLRALETPSAFRFGTLSGILQFSPDTILMTTIKNGIFYYDGKEFLPWKTPHDAFLKQNIIFSARMCADGNVAIGTALDGLILLDRKRRILQHLNKQSGLQNNTVLCLSTARNGGLWLGLDNGISFAAVSSAVSSIYPDGELQGTGYSACIFDNKIYFGTNTGLYATDWKSYYSPGAQQRFSKVQNADGQVWSLGALGGELLMGHHEGAFAVEGLRARKIAQVPGVWRFVQLDQEYALAGCYEGMLLFRKRQDRWAYEGPLEGLRESSRLLARDAQGHIWMAHPYRGIFKVNPEPALQRLKAEFFGGAHGLPSNLGNHVFQVGEEAVFTASNGVFSFDDGKKCFLPDSRFEKLFGLGVQMRYLSQDERGNIWYATEREAGLLMVSNSPLDKKVRRLPIPELSGRLAGGFQFVLPVDEHNVFIATDRGFIHFDLGAYLAQDSILRLVLHEVRLKSGPDSLLFGGHSTPPVISLASNRNSLVFTFAAPDHPGSEYVRFSHWLEGADRGWTEWSGETELVFNNLPAGTYTLHLKARNPQGVESAVLQFVFTIQPPWYASRVAFVCYGLLLAGLVGGIIYRQQHRFAQEKKGLVDRHEKQIRSSEEAINRLEKEKLEAAVRHQHEELAMSTLHLMQKSEILHSLRSNLEKLKSKYADAPELQKEIGRVVKIIDQDAHTDAVWEQFSQHFDQVHNDFLKRLAERHPNLTPTEYKLCAYLRLNLSSKEIATLMNISVRGVETSRYRLRKHLGLDEAANLTGYLMGL